MPISHVRLINLIGQIDREVIEKIWKTNLKKLIVFYIIKKRLSDTEEILKLTNLSENYNVSDS